jgi:DNA helicase INO80
MYNQLRSNMSIVDLMNRASSLSDDDSVKRLMNLIMQFRKVRSANFSVQRPIAILT